MNDNDNEHRDSTEADMLEGHSFSGGVTMGATNRPTARPQGHLPVVPPGKIEIDEVRFPDLADLLARLHFSTSDGRIWLDEQRMLLIHASALGTCARR